MFEITQEDGKEITQGAELIEFREQAGKNKSVAKLKTESGFVIMFTEKGTESYYYMDADEDRSIDSLLRANCTSLSGEMEELELYRWGLEVAEEATIESFGEYRLLLRTSDGHIKWHKNDGKTAIYTTLEEAVAMSQAKLLTGVIPIVV